MKYTGIWLDLEQAKLIEIKDSGSSIRTIDSNIDPGKVKGGSRSKKPYGPMDKISESKHLAKREQQLKNYFLRISKTIDTKTDLVIMGPSQTKQRFKKYLDNDSNFSSTAYETMSLDSLTDNQLIEAVKKHFNLVIKRL